jgi:acyl carrier protein
MNTEEMEMNDSSTALARADEEVLTSLKEALRYALSPSELEEINVDGITQDTPMLSLALDSLGLMMVVDYIERQLGVRMSADEIYTFTAVSELVEYVVATSQ